MVRIISNFENSHKKYNKRNGFDFRTALHIAAEKGHIAVTKFLLEHGANLEARDDEGW